MTKVFVFSEILFSILYVSWVMFFTSYFGLIGAMYAFLVNYVLYLVFTFTVFSLYLNKLPNGK